MAAAMSANTSPHVQTVWSRTAVVLFVVAAVLGLLLLVYFTPALLRLVATNPLSDVHAYYDAATRLNHGLPLYSPNIDVNASEYYRYPPLVAVAFRPLALLPFPAAAAAWEALMVASLALTIRMAGVRRATVLALCALALPIAWSLALGQAQVLVTWLVAVASPFSVALAGQLKVFPALVALYFLGRRDWRWLRRFVAWSLGLVAIQIVLEPPGSIAFLRIANLEQVGGIDNLSPYGISPLLWAVMAVFGAVATLALARTRYGWAAAVWYSTLVTPRLISYLVMALLAALGRRDGRPR
jgi:hypothetical protein